MKNRKNEQVASSIWRGSKWLILMYIIGIIFGMRYLLISVTSENNNLINYFYDIPDLFSNLILIAAFVTLCGRWRLVWRGLFPRGKAWSVAEAKRIGDYFWILSRTTCMIGVVSTLLMFVAVIGDFAPQQIMDFIHVLFLPIFYAAILDLLIFIPVAVLAMKQAQKQPTDNDITNETSLQQSSRKTKVLRFAIGWLITLLSVWVIMRFNGVSSSLLFDLPSIGVVGGFLIIYLAARWKLFKKQPLNTEYKVTTSKFFERLAHIILYSGLIGMAFGFAYMSYVQLNPEKIGHGIDMILLSQTYAILLSVFVFTPLSVQLNEDEK